MPTRCGCFLTLHFEKTAPASALARSMPAAPESNSTHTFFIPIRRAGRLDAASSGDPLAAKTSSPVSN